VSRSWPDRVRRLLVAVRHDAGLSLILTLQAGIMFVVAPLSATGWLSFPVVEAFRFGLAAAAVVTVTRNGLAILLIIVSFALSILLSGEIRAPHAALAIDIARLALTTTFDLVVAVVVARVAFGPGPVTVHRILGGVILYLSIGLIFANLYRVAALTLQPSFSGEILYFSLGALTTGGSGTILPVHPFVRSLANLESVVGQLFPATLLARLVSLHAAGAGTEIAAAKEPLAPGVRTSPAPDGPDAET
jgi:hypothetical protein